MSKGIISMCMLNVLKIRIVMLMAAITIWRYFSVQIITQTGEFVVGLPFGYADMSKEEIEHEVSAYVRSQLDATFLGLVQNYLKKEHLMEEWLADQCPHES